MVAQEQMIGTCSLLYTAGQMTPDEAKTTQGDSDCSKKYK